jgi:uncharacterized membrane protein
MGHDVRVSDPVVHPAEHDPVVAAAAERVGGPVGRRRGGLSGYWTPLRVLVGLTAIAYSIGFLTKMPCVLESFGGDAAYTRLCYSDIPPLYQLRGFADGWLPYLQTGAGQGPALEYPVLTGFFMQIAAWITGLAEGGARTMFFFAVNAVMLFACLVVTVVCTALVVRRRPWDGAFVALAPALILTAFINWDLFAVALTAGSMLAWSRRRIGWSGVLLGLAIAAKFYPLLLLGPLLVLCLRAGRMRSYGVLLGSTALTWLAVNLPVYLVNPVGWAQFYTFSAERSVSWGSIWYALRAMKLGVPEESVNVVATGLLLVLCLGIAVLILKAPQRPRYAQVAFLVVAAFCLTNKVYSPQFVIWLVPLAALARPRWRDFLIWQAGELVHFAATWWFLHSYGNDNKGLPEGWYVAAILVHVAATAYFAGMIVRDILRPEHDPIRSDGVPEHRDDPGGGVLDGAPDVVGGRRRALAEEQSPALVGAGAPTGPEDDDGGAGPQADTPDGWR